MSTWGRSYLLLALFTLVPCVPAQANDRPTERPPRVELSLRSWIFTHGETQWSHDASSLDPTLGNPTSQLTYKDNSTHIVEGEAKVRLSRHWFLQGYVGTSVDFDRGRLVDDDYAAGQYLFSRTSSRITGTGTWYLSGNIGYRVAEFPNGRGHLNVVGGIRYWMTEYEATGFDRVVCDPAFTSCTPQSSSARAITNTTHWIEPLKLGVDTDYRITERLSIGLRVSVNPISVVFNEDVHHLRSDLRQDPSFSMWGVGVGAGAEPTVKFLITRNLAVTAGYRVWWNRTYYGRWEFHPIGGGSETVPLDAFQTIRHGATVGLTGSF